MDTLPETSNSYCHPGKAGGTPHGLVPHAAAPDSRCHRNPEPGTRNPEPGTRNPEPGTWNIAPGIQSKRLCALLDLEKSTLSRNVALMVAHGWIDARRAGRAQTLGLTPQGAAKLASALPEWQRAQRSTQRLLSTGDVAILRRAWGLDLQ